MDERFNMFVQLLCGKKDDRFIIKNVDHSEINFVG